MNLQSKEMSKIQNAISDQLREVTLRQQQLEEVNKVELLSHVIFIYNNRGSFLAFFPEIARKSWRSEAAPWKLPVRWGPLQ